MSCNMKFPPMWYMWPAKAQTSLRIRAVWSEPLLVIWIFSDSKATDRTSFGMAPTQARLSLHLSNYYIVGIHMSRLNYFVICTKYTNKICLNQRLELLTYFLTATPKVLYKNSTKWGEVMSLKFPVNLHNIEVKWILISPAVCLLYVYTIYYIKSTDGNVNVDNCKFGNFRDNFIFANNVMTYLRR